MNEIELTLEIPAASAGPADFPEAGALPRRGEVGRAEGLDGQQFLQLTVAVGLGSVQVLKTWLLARSERFKHSRVEWKGQTLEAYTPKEIERLVRLLETGLGEESPNPEDTSKDQV
jgi:hypothetical protein